MAWEAGVAAADVAGAAFDWLAPDAGRMWPGLALPVGATAVGLRKRQQLFANNDDDARVLEPPSKKARPSRPNLPQVSRAGEYRDMGLLTYRRQVIGSRGRSRRRVRRLARAGRRQQYSGSKPSLICNQFPLIWAAGSARENLRNIAYYTPSLAQVIKEVSDVYKVDTGKASTRITNSFSVSIPRQRWDFAFTPDWPTHTSTAVAVTVRLSKFVLNKKLPINEVIATPAASAPSGVIPDIGYYCARNYEATAPTAGINGLPYDHAMGIVQRNTASAGQTTAPTLTDDQWLGIAMAPLTVFESPAFMSKVTFKWGKEFYIPYGQSMKYTCSHGPMNISYNNLEINRPEYYEAKVATTNGDNFITPYLPAGWPVYMFEIQKHLASGSSSVTNLVAADAFSVTHRMYYKIPDYPGRNLTWYGSNYNSGGVTPRYANVLGTANGTGKANAYTGLNV